MRPYTFGMTPEHVIEEALPTSYQMSLNKPDMLELLNVLKQAEDAWAVDFRTSILETIGIEEV